MFRSADALVPVRGRGVVQSRQWASSLPTIARRTSRAAGSIRARAAAAGRFRLLPAQLCLGPGPRSRRPPVAGPRKTAGAAVGALLRLQSVHWTPHVRGCVRDRMRRRQWSYMPVDRRVRAGPQGRLREDPAVPQRAATPPGLKPGRHLLLRRLNEATCESRWGPRSGRRRIPLLLPLAPGENLPPGLRRLRLAHQLTRRRARAATACAPGLCRSGHKNGRQSGCCIRSVDSRTSPLAQRSPSQYATSESRR